jgi:plasmid segregation protein ParM
MINKGLDTGYRFTKDNEHRIFASAYSTNDRTITGANKITINGKDRYVGVGAMTSDVDKIDTELNEACVINNLAMTGEYEYCLTVGLPIGQFKAQKDKFKERILDYNKCDVIYNDKEFDVKIKDVFVFPQGAAALYSIPRNNSDKIIIDIGGLTFDIAYVETILNNPSITKSDTWYKGMRTLYSGIIQEVNLKFGLRLEISEAEKILLKGLRINGVEQSLDFLQPTLCNYLDPIADEIRMNYPTETTQIYICGGGARILYNALARRFKQVILIPDCQFANALGYYELGARAFAKYL